jgi:predicted small secreted protein
MRSKDTILLEQAYEAVYVTESLALRILEEAGVDTTPYKAEKENPLKGGVMGKDQFKVMSGQSDSAVKPKSSIDRFIAIGNAVNNQLKLNGKKAIGLVAALALVAQVISANPTTVGKDIQQNEKDVEALAQEILSQPQASQNRQNVVNVSRQSDQELEKGLNTQVKPQFRF